MISISSSSDEDLSQYLFRIQQATSLKSNYDKLKYAYLSPISCDKFHKCEVLKSNELSTYLTQYIEKLNGQQWKLSSMEGLEIEKSTFPADDGLNISSAENLFSGVNKVEIANASIEKNTGLSIADDLDFSSTCESVFKRVSTIENTTVDVKTANKDISSIRKKKKNDQNKAKNAQSRKIALGKYPGFICDKCGYKVKTMCLLTVHQKFCNGEERPFVCSVCNMSFVRRLHLMRHFNAHSKYRLYSCESCGKTFHRKDYLAKHIKSHEKLRIKLRLYKQGIVQSVLKSKLVDDKYILK